jgi:hypothetical protein
MAVLATKTVNDNLVYYDNAYPHRWLDAIGPNVVKYSFDASKVISTTTAAGFTPTLTNGTLVSADSTTGGAVVFTLAGAENDKVQVQSFSELFKFANAWPAYFGCKFKLVDVSENDVHFGFIIRDTLFSDGVSDGVYFRLADGSAIASFVLEKDSTETTTEIATLADNTIYTAEFYYDGAGYVHAYLNGALVTSVATSNANWPNDEDLAFSLGVESGAVAANHGTIYWARGIQIQNP